MSATAQSASRPGGMTALSVNEQFLTFALGDELFAIPILSVQEIRGWERVSAIPRAPSHVLGVINLRGTVVPVVDVRARLGMVPRDVTSTTVVIVVRIEISGGTTTVGCVVDAVSDVVNIDGSAIGPAPDICGRMEHHFVSGVTSMDQGLVMLLDLQGLVDSSIAAAVS